jgi:hypothetical protein
MIELNDNDLEPCRKEWRGCLMAEGYTIDRINDMCHGFAKGQEWYIQEVNKKLSKQPITQKHIKNFLETNAEKEGYEGRSYMAGFYDALSVEEDQKKKGIFDTPINIIPLDCAGVIIGIFLGRSYGIEYKVRYYLDGKQYDNYFFEHEVKGL